MLLLKRVVQRNAHPVTLSALLSHGVSTFHPLKSADTSAFSQKCLLRHMRICSMFPSSPVYVLTNMPSSHHHQSRVRIVRNGWQSDGTHTHTGLTLISTDYRVYGLGYLETAISAERVFPTYPNLSVGAAQSVERAKLTHTHRTGRAHSMNGFLGPRLV